MKRILDARRTWQPPRPTVPRRADHTAIVGCDLFVDGVAVESPGSAADLRRLHEKAREQDGAFVWLGLHEPSEASLTRVADVFGLHPLAVEDVLHREQRVKIERCWPGAHSRSRTPSWTASSTPTSTSRPRCRPTSI